MLFFSLSSLSQETLFELEFEIELDSIGINLDGTEIQLFQDDHWIKTPFSDSTGIGGFSNLTPNHIYHVKFQREGFVTKLVEFNLNSYLFEDPDFFVRGNGLQVSLFKTLPHEKFSFLEEEPIVKFYVEPKGSFPLDKTFSSSFKNLSYNEADFRRMSLKVRLCMEGLTGAQAENYILLAWSDKVTDNDEVYEQAIELGDILFHKNSYVFARSMYTTAINVTEKKRYAKSQIKRCNKNLKSKTR